MDIIKWEPLSNIDRFFENLPYISFPKTEWDLAIDIFEKNDNIIAEMNLPGIDPKDVEISVEDNHLRVSGSRKEEREEKKKHYYSKEIKRGSFERVVTLPSRVQKDKVKAEYDNGVLQITLPKIAKGVNGKKVEIKVKGEKAEKKGK